MTGGGGHETASPRAQKPDGKDVGARVNVAHVTELLFIGFFTAAGLYSALLYVITRDKPFLWYAALMDSMAFAQLVFAADLLTLSPQDHRFALFRVCVLSLFVGAEAAFAFAFLQLRRQLPTFASAVSALAAIGVLMLVAQYALGAAPALRAAGHLIFFAMLAACAAAAYHQMRGGHEDARYFVYGFCAALAGVTLSTLADYRNWGHWAEYFFQFGVALQGALLALSLAARYAKLDPLTGVKSRRAFEERLPAAWRNAREDGTGLAVIFIAIDGFKAYDAKHGRIAGDALLRRISHLCSGCCRDRADLFARYGDEEFAAIIPRVSQEQADAIASRMCAIVAESTLITIRARAASIERGADSAPALLRDAQTVLLAS